MSDIPDRQMPLEYCEVDLEEGRQNSFFVMQGVLTWMDTFVAVGEFRIWVPILHSGSANIFAFDVLIEQRKAKRNPYT
ncbi:hypothetical protein EYC84_002056 [Monilinia fructicola]|uniref:Uncharacterized protein n=1 Tax=Monilinia fructicola TaxID=38448 RepID=A0A5M9JSA8_MONFR|nr:hypothetical protein EYC84_002056 [Monilinia fructicola]